MVHVNRMVYDVTWKPPGDDRVGAAAALTAAMKIAKDELLSRTLTKEKTDGTRALYH